MGDYLQLLTSLRKRKGREAHGVYSVPKMLAYSEEGPSLKEGSG
jgi:hypothetical protein